MGAPRIPDDKKKQIMRLLEIPELSQAEIADICGVGKATVSDIKNRKSKLAIEATSADVDTIISLLTKNNELLQNLLDVWSEKK